MLLCSWSWIPAGDLVLLLVALAFACSSCSNPRQTRHGEKAQGLEHGESAIALHRALPNSKLLLIEDCGHLP
jgi:hypothetical protein